MYSTSPNLDKNKVFLVKRSELENKLEVSYYNPKIRAIEEAIKVKASKNLKDYIVKIASGATPSVIESQKYYSDRANGVPFLRVQNLKTNGKLNLDEVKYINKETHNNYLKRSQVFEGDLLIKITGVGRMAIASVAPVGFEGNTNQHMVVIKTKGKQTSEYLAKYLNLDVIEKLASQRATGGTRPALDYTALKSIPIVENIDFTLLNDAFEQKKSKEQEAKSLLENIDKYLLAELGIVLPTRDNSFSNRVFEINWSEVSGDRFDAFSFFNNALKMEGGNFPNKKLRELATVNKGQSITSANVIEGDYPVIAGGKTSPYSHNEYNNEGKTITVSASGAYAGYVWYHNEEIFASDCAVIKSNDKSVISMDYLAEILILKQTEIYGLQQGAGQPHVYPSDLVKLNIPLPPLEVQNRITDHIFELREKAKQLESEAKSVLKEAKSKIEKMIIG